MNCTPKPAKNQGASHSTTNKPSKGSPKKATTLRPGTPGKAGQFGPRGR